MIIVLLRKRTMIIVLPRIPLNPRSQRNKGTLVILYTPKSEVTGEQRTVVIVLLRTFYCTPTTPTHVCVGRTRVLGGGGRLTSFIALPSRRSRTSFHYVSVHYGFHNKYVSKNSLTTVFNNTIFTTVFNTFPRNQFTIQYLISDSTTCFITVPGSSLDGETTAKSGYQSGGRAQAHGLERLPQQDAGGAEGEGAGAQFPVSRERGAGRNFVAFESIGERYISLHLRAYLRAQGHLSSHFVSTPPDFEFKSCTRSSKDFSYG